ncbi:Multidrug resistance-associated protein [Blattamonas nauphoetae]|uniref:Multidrug resistance-associated protein n=1 Tax=Blattamonas nauphoetae TaxID=2049346 RepID=A0ABQ9X7L9_9EUKA|nr:Multidrug resistance-associated protein [Blattamonas nauphoetae]
MEKIRVTPSVGASNITSLPSRSSTLNTITTGTTDSIASLTITGMLNYSTSAFTNKKIVFDTYSFTPRPFTNLPIPHLHILIITVFDRNPIEGRHNLNLISIAVWLVLMPVSMVATMMMGVAMQKYLGTNDEFNKTMNETLQGMRVVVAFMAAGLDQATARVDVVTICVELSSSSGFMHSLLLALSLVQETSCLCADQPAITGDVERVNRRVCVRGSIAFCHQIAWINNSTVRGRKTMRTTMLPMDMEAAMMMNVSLKRLAQFLYLPEMEEVEDSAETRLRNPSIAVEIEGAKAAAALRAQTNTTSGFGHETTDAPSSPVHPEYQHSSVTPSTEPFTKGSEGVFKMAANNEDAMDGEFNEDEAASNTINPPATPTMTPTPPRTPTAMSTASSGDGPTLQEMNISIRKGSLTMIVGEVGSGKSSFGAAIVGDVEHVNGTVCVRGSIAFCPQIAWINNNTVRGNITFNAAFDKEKYWETVRICALEPDFKVYAAGDETVIGEMGVNLSGGQKARIQLARAMYSDRDIVEMDDPLSAVDAHVGRMQMDECILGRLKGKSVVLMTNQIQFLDRADKVVTLKDGKIIGQGRYEELREQGINFDEFIIQKEKKEKKKEKEKKGAAQHEKTSRLNIQDAENTSTSADLLTNADEHETDSNNQSSCTPSPTLSNTASPFEDKEKAKKAARQMMMEEEQSTDFSFHTSATESRHLSLEAGKVIFTLLKSNRTSFEHIDSDFCDRTGRTFGPKPIATESASLSADWCDLEASLLTSSL